MYLLADIINFIKMGHKCNQIFKIEAMQRYFQLN
jgi:hypothetical protein